MADLASEEDTPSSEDLLYKIKRNLAIAKLKSGELKWKEYIDSLTPEELEQEREYKRYWAKVWYQNNKDKKREYSKEFYSKNKEEMTARRKQSQLDKRAVMTQEEKDKILERKRAYYSNNRDKMIQGKRDWKEKNKERLHEQHYCEVCNTHYTYISKWSHMRARYHRDAIVNANQ